MICQTTFNTHKRKQNFRNVNFSFPLPTRNVYGFLILYQTNNTKCNGSKMEHLVKPLMPSGTTMIKVLRNLLKLCVPLPTVLRGIVTAFIILKHMPQQFYNNCHSRLNLCKAFCFFFDAATCFTTEEERSIPGKHKAMKTSKVCLCLLLNT